MTDLTKMQERLAFVEAEIARVRPDRIAYQRYQRGKAPHPGQEVAGNSGYYGRRVVERTQLRKGIAAAEARAAKERAIKDAWPAPAEVEAQLADLNARIEADANVPHGERRQRGLTELIALAMGQSSTLQPDQHERRERLAVFIDYCFDEIKNIKETSHELQEVPRSA